MAIMYLLRNHCVLYLKKAGSLLIAKRNNLVNQEGYHNKFIGTFKEVKRILDEGYIGDICYFAGESYGTVVIKAK